MSIVQDLAASPLISWRGLLALQATLGLLMYGGMIGHFWRRLSWPLRYLSVAGGGVGVYVLLAQVKAFNLGIPSDGYSATGVVAYTAVITALLAVRYVERRRTKEA